MPVSFDTISPLAVLDLLIVITLVCGALRILRKDSALRISLLLVVLLVALFAAQAAGLAITAALLHAFLSSSLIIIAIIFQNEIRRMLFTLGRAATSQVNEEEAAEDTVQLLQAVTEMSYKRIGALIVIVRKTPIDHLIEVGTDLNAKVTSELLNSIFQPYSPIHDGAVIIKDGKLTRAGCLLPLSGNPDIARSFGTRHRAALGLSEISDAQIVVVSEETGKISLVHDAKIHYDVDRDELRNRLREPVQRPAKSSANPVEPTDEEL